MNINFKSIISILLLFVIFSTSFYLFYTENVIDFINYKVKYLSYFTLIFLFLFFFTIYLFSFNSQLILKFFQKMNNKVVLILIISGSFLLILMIKILIINNISIQTLTGLNEHRATHWVTTYQDFGFIKRSLVGSLIKLLKFNYPTYIDILVISYAILLLKIFLIYKIILKIMTKYHNNIINLSFYLFISSPCFIHFYISDIGRLDQINNLIMVFVLFYMLKNHNLVNKYILGILVFIALLIHEAFVLLQMPFIMYLISLNYINSFNKFNFYKIIKDLSFPIFSSLIGIIIIIKFGFIDNFNLTEAANILSSVKSFDIRVDVLHTFFVKPWENWNIKDHFLVGISTKYSLPIYLTLIEFTIINLPFLILNLLLFSKILKQLSKIYFNYIYILILIIALPLLVSTFITFVDYYRVYASIGLFIFLSNAYLLLNNDLLITNISYNTSLKILFIGIFYNFYMIGTNIITSFSSSSVSLVFKIIYNLL